MTKVRIGVKLAQSILKHILRTYTNILKRIIQFGVAPVQIDILNEIDGVEFEEAEKHQTRGRYGTFEVNFIGKEDLIQNKRSSGRTQDRADVENLE